MMRPAQEQSWVIRKNGFFYRPDRAGYTLSIREAGLYTEAEAKAEAAVEPDKMSAHPAADFHDPWRALEELAREIQPYLPVDLSGHEVRITLNQDYRSIQCIALELLSASSSLRG